MASSASTPPATTVTMALAMHMGEEWEALNAIENRDILKDLQRCRRLVVCMRGLVLTTSLHEKLLAEIVAAVARKQSPKYLADPMNSPRTRYVRVRIQRLILAHIDQERKWGEYRGVRRYEQSALLIQRVYRGFVVRQKRKLNTLFDVIVATHQMSKLERLRADRFAFHKQMYDDREELIRVKHELQKVEQEKAKTEHTIASSKKNVVFIDAKMLDGTVVRMEAHQLLLHQLNEHEKLVKLCKELELRVMEHHKKAPVVHHAATRIQSQMMDSREACYKRMNEGLRQRQERLWRDSAGTITSCYSIIQAKKVLYRYKHERAGNRIAAICLKNDERCDFLVVNAYFHALAPLGHEHRDKFTAEQLWAIAMTQAFPIVQSLYQDHGVTTLDELMHACCPEQYDAPDPPWAAQLPAQVFAKMKNVAILMKDVLERVNAAMRITNDDVSLKKLLRPSRNLPHPAPTWSLRPGVSWKDFEAGAGHGTPTIASFSWSFLDIMGGGKPASEQDSQLRAPLNPKEPAPAPSAMAGGPTALCSPRTVPDASNSHASGFTSLADLPRTVEMSWWGRIKAWDAPSLIRFMRYVNIVLALLQAIAGFMGLFDLAMLDVTSFLISIYAIIFALLLMAFECRFKSMEPKIRDQFGFLFTYRGRTAFIFCIGFMNFGMRGALAWLVGVLMLGNALFNMLLMLCHPEFRNGHLSSKMDPTATYTEASEESAQLLARNPEFTAKAGAFVVNQAQKNPEFATQMAQSYAAQAMSSPQGTYVPPVPSPSR
ncbi:TPA: hypothetical protein N0F65_007911 [Lagenidium giganteum]|uniref:Uncharacterized protein n=1 Tax=Lagenidium giganteum TaxID=4803 RepID=A0AAV2Z4A3_9STRA|nr:TPA: hypothetical protein N0F65_007911 [Lagenidium giganteum]